jgi:imidazolonepropionase-like amidohydrolase
MKQHGVVFFPTLAAVESIQRYRGWTKGKDPEPAVVQQKKKSFKIALDAGVTIGMGGDVGVYRHGENVYEMELMAEYGMKPLDILKAATTVNARALHMENEVGSIKPGLLADLVVVDGNPLQAISQLRQVKWVMKNGVICRNEYGAR